MVVLPMQPFLLATTYPFAIAKRVELIERVDALLDDSPEEAIPDDAPSDRAKIRKTRLRELMYGPLAFAREYRQRFTAPVWALC